MKGNLDALSQRYATALEKYLMHGPHATRARLRSALILGRQAVSLGFGAIELAGIHDRAIALLKFPASDMSFGKRAKSFFTEALIPIIRKRESREDNTLLNKTPNPRAERLAATNRSLRLGIARHKTMEAALRKNDESSRKLMEESHQVQKDLRHLAHGLLASQEDKRRKLSSSLRDEIAQTLLGINVWLLALKRGAAFNSTGFQKDIARTQRLVEQSIRFINQFARELDIHT